MPEIKMVIVVYTPFGWDDRRFHRRRVIEALAAQLGDEGIILGVNPYICLTTSWLRSKGRATLRALWRTGGLEQVLSNVYILTPFVWLPPRWHRLHEIKAVNWKMLSWQICTTLERIAPKIQHRVGWFYRPEQADLIGLAGEDLVVYECYDKYEGDHGLPDDSLANEAERDRVRRQEASILSRADVVFVVSELLLREKQRVHSNVHLIHNAAETTRFAAVQDARTPLAKMMKGLSYPIIGYFGNLTPRIDLELVEYIAQTKPSWTIVIVGGDHNAPSLNESKVYQHFVRLSNVKFSGWVYEDLPSYFKAIDVCVIPYRIDLEFNTYSDPYKLYDYLAMGKPVVSTDIPCVRSHADIIYIARTKEEFVACIEQALAEDGPEKIAERLRRAQENTWEKRAERMLKIIWETLLNTQS